MLTGKVQVSSQRSTTGGKGNRGKYIDRSKCICPAGIPTAQGDDDIKSCFQHYLLKEEVDALVNDAIIPPAPPRPLAPTRHPPDPDMRNSNSINSELAELINPPKLSKFQSLVNDLKDTSYKSYWKKRLGAVPDPTPMFPKGYDIENTTFGKKRPDEGTLYELIMPKEPLRDMTPKSKEPAAQIDRKYSRPAFNPDVTYGYKTNIDKRGIYMKCNMTDAKVIEGTADRVPISSIQVEMQKKRTPTMGKVLAPNNNISYVPKGYTFGITTRPEYIPEQKFSYYTINPRLSLFRKCLSHLNTLRKVLSKRFLPSFFNQFFLLLNHEDKNKTGWLPKEVVYDNCATHMIRFDPSQIEPLLCMLKVFDGSNIEYKTFTHILNIKQPLPDLPKVPDIHPDCLDFRTTYSEMVKPVQPRDESLRAGIPSGRYLDLDRPITPDNYCAAHRTDLPDESDISSCLNPSIFTLLHVSHRDMYAKREPEMVRRIFEAAGEVFTDELFNQVWEEAKKYHSEGWVCYETFKRSLELFPASTEADNSARK